MPKTVKKSWFSIEAKDNGTEADVIIYDEIGVFGVTAKDFINEVKPLDVDTINLRLNSPGGNVFEGVAIFNVLKEHSARVVAHVDGVAASIASFIAMAADEIQMASNSFMMIHDPVGLAVGGKAEMDRMASMLDRLAGTIATAYVNKSGQTIEAIRALMADETWFTGEEAVEAGLADTVTGAVEVAATFDMSKFSNAPKEITDSFTAAHPSIRDLETALREAGGLSKSEAKGLLAKGYSALEHRDDAGAPHRDDGNKQNANTQEEAPVNIKELKAQHPDLYNEVHALGVDSVDVEGAVAKYKTGEIARIVDVRAQSMPGFESIIDDMVADGKSTGGDAAKAITALQRKQMDEAKDKIAKDAKGVKVPEAPTGALGAGGVDDGKKDFEQLVAACMEAQNIKLGAATSIVAKAHPKAHTAYLAKVNTKEAA